MSLRALVGALSSATPSAIRRRGRLTYRDFVFVALVLDRSKSLSDNWIYVHTPGVQVGRIQNFNNWSAAMVPHENQTCVGMEYFCFEGTHCGIRPRRSRGAATRELESLKLAAGLK